MGNLVLESSSVRNESISALTTLVADFLTRTEWPGDEPVLVVAWGGRGQLTIYSMVDSPRGTWRPTTRRDLRANSRG